MANRRMLSKSITSSSSFLMMPLSAQGLYMQLNQAADDDGYCEYFGVMRLCGAQPDDLGVLRARAFVRVFDDKVLLMRDWKENNYIQIDRYHKSKYLDVYNMDTECIQDVPETYTEVRLGKVRLGKANTIQAVVSKKTTAGDDRSAFLETMRPGTRALWDAWEQRFAEITTNLAENRTALNALLALEGSQEKAFRLMDLAAKAWTEKYAPKEAKASSPAQLWLRRGTLLAWGKGQYAQKGAPIPVAS